MEAAHCALDEYMLYEYEAFPLATHEPFLQLLEAVKFVHGHGYIHMDLKARSRTPIPTRRGRATSSAGGPPLPRRDDDRVHA